MELETLSEGRVTLALSIPDLILLSRICRHAAETELARCDTEAVAVEAIGTSLEAAALAAWVLADALRPCTASAYTLTALQAQFAQAGAPAQLTMPVAAATGERTIARKRAATSA